MYVQRFFQGTQKWNMYMYFHMKYQSINVDSIEEMYELSLKELNALESV